MKIYKQAGTGWLDYNLG